MPEFTEIDISRAIIDAYSGGAGTGG